MKPAVILLLAVCTAGSMTPHGVQAASTRIPDTVYPSGAHIQYDATLSNAAMDCLWGFLCEGGYLPLFHSHLQDALHRTGGWAQFAGVHQHGRMVMAFELFVSRYDSISGESGVPWSELAFLDFESVVLGQGYVLDQHDMPRLPSPPGGAGLIAVQDLDGEDLVVMALWSGTLEVEGIASYHHRPAARQTAWTALIRQVRLAVQRGA